MRVASEVQKLMPRRTFLRRSQIAEGLSRAQAAALPVIMDDNYFTLLRGETRKVDIEIDESLLGEDTYKLVARPYND